MSTDALLPWYIYAAEGELIARCHYAIDAARVALTQGTGATVQHGGSVMLTVQERATTWEAADETAKAMIEAAYGP